MNSLDAHLNNVKGINIKVNKLLRTCILRIYIHKAKSAHTSIAFMLTDSVRMSQMSESFQTIHYKVGSKERSSFCSSNTAINISNCCLNSDKTNIVYFSLMSRLDLQRFIQQMF